MAELTTDPTTAAALSCCSAEMHATCCEPSEKAACCGQRAAGAGCGCSAGHDAETSAATVAHDIRETVRERYAQAARAVASADSASVAASLGCGVPTAVADLHEGETVLDLGSGAGADVLISARRVGETGRVIGLDMTDEMLELARANAQHAGVSNVQFVKGYIEDIPPTPPPPARCGTSASVSAPAMHPVQAAMSARVASSRSGSAITSETASRPPGVSTRAAGGRGVGDRQLDQQRSDAAAE